MKKYLNLLYVILPPIFYIIPFFFSNLKNEVSLHFFKTFYVNKYFFVYLSFSYLLLGYLVLWTINDTKFSFHKRFSISRSLDLFLSISYLFSYYLGFSYISSIFNLITYIIIGSFKPGKTSLLVLIIISLYELLFNNNRFPVIYTFLIFYLPYLNNLSYKKLIIYVVCSILFLVYILQPLRSGVLPFSTQTRFTSLYYLYTHLNPIYIGAYLSYELNFTIDILLSEIIPFAKNFLNFESVIDRIADVGLPNAIIDSNIRHGSNSAMYFHFYGFLIVAITLIIIKYLMKKLNIKLIYNSVLIYLIVQGPYFVRRAIGSFLLDIILIISISLIIIFIKQLYFKNKKLQIN